jgi:hypothetical protein
LTLNLADLPPTVPSSASGSGPRYRNRGTCCDCSLKVLYLYKEEGGQCTIWKEDTQIEVMMDWTEILGLERAKTEGYHLQPFREVGKVFTEQIHPSDL